MNRIFQFAFPVLTIQNILHFKLFLSFKLGGNGGAELPKEVYQEGAVENGIYFQCGWKLQIKGYSTDLSSYGEWFNKVGFQICRQLFEGKKSDRKPYVVSNSKRHGEFPSNNGQHSKCRNL